MPIAGLTTQERKAHMVRLPEMTSEEVRDFAVSLGMTMNAAINLLVREALDARKK